MKGLLRNTFCLLLMGSWIGVSNLGLSQLNQIDKGGFYLYWGYNRSVYTKSDLRFVGPGYDYTLQGVKAIDRPEKISWVYLNPKNITIPQFNLRLGYFFKDKWAATIGYDHLKYVMAHPQTVRINGHVDPGISTLWSGDYHNKKTQLPHDQIHYENSNGLNYIRVGVARYFDLLSVGENNWFRVRANVEASAGFLLCFNDFNFGGQYDEVTVSVTGYGISLHPGLRLEFFNHIFIQGHLVGGFMHQTKVRTRPEDRNAFARQHFFYAELDLEVGYTWRFNRKAYDKKH